jgi:hypothetical protein
VLTRPPPVKINTDADVDDGRKRIQVLGLWLPSPTRRTSRAARQGPAWPQGMGRKAASRLVRLFRRRHLRRPPPTQAHLWRRGAASNAIACCRT